MAFGFSVGDFVALGKVIEEISSRAKHAKSEYQELIRELESLDRALRHLDRLETTGQLKLGLDGIKCAALACRVPLEEFLNKIQKYDASLALRSSDGKVKSAARRVEWAVSIKDDVRRLQSYLGVHVNTINMLLMQQGLEALDVATRQGEATQSEIRKRVEETSAQVEYTRVIVAEIKDDVREQALMTQTNTSILNTLRGLIRGDIKVSLQALTEMVARICITTQQMYGLLLDLRSRQMTPDTRWTFFQEPVRVEDALGRIFPFPSELSFDDLEVLIRHRFKEGPGKQEVSWGDYELINKRNSRPLAPSASGTGLLPGMSIVMAIVMYRPTPAEPVACPMRQCASVNTVTCASGGRTCCECNVWFDQCSRKRQTITDETTIYGLFRRYAFFRHEYLKLHMEWATSSPGKSDLLVPYSGCAIEKGPGRFKNIRCGYEDMMDMYRPFPLLEVSIPDFP